MLGKRLVSNDLYEIEIINFFSKRFLLYIWTDVTKAASLFHKVSL